MISHQEWSNEGNENHGRISINTSKKGRAMKEVRGLGTLGSKGDVDVIGNCNIFQVVQSPLDVDRGMSVLFKAKAPKDVLITESADLNIEFYIDNPTEICNNTVWEVEGFPAGTDQSPLFLSTNGVTGNPLEVATWFQIRKANEWGYKLVFCPFAEDVCGDIGIKDVDGQRRLALGTDNTFNVVFLKDIYSGIKSII